MKHCVLFLIFSLSLFSCSKDRDDTPQHTQISLNFTHNWDGDSISITDFNTLKFTNANGEQLSIVRLRYLISKVTLTKTSGETIVLDGYNLVNVTNNENLIFTPETQIPTGDYSNLTFTFGFTNEANTDGIYQDLNAASWNVPGMLGGGYHYMQFDGKYINSKNQEEGFNYHAIRAVRRIDNSPTFPQDTFFEVNLGQVTLKTNTTIEVKMNVAEWFKNPNTWDLNQLNTMLMPNADAQIMMHANGQTVFSKGAIN